LKANILPCISLQTSHKLWSPLDFMLTCALVFGSPVGGKILGENVLGNYRSVVLFDAALLIGATICIAGVRYRDAIDKKVWKWVA